MTPPDTLAEDVHAAAAAQSELGADYDRAVLRSLADRLETELDARDRQRRSAVLREAVTVVIALGSIGLGVTFALASDGLGSSGATIATIVAWVAIAVINVAHARRHS
jgi:hypothetical protein